MRTTSTAMTGSPTFLRQVLYGCVRYKDALRVFLKHYYNDMASSVLRNDFTLYMVLGYLLLFRLDELGFGDFRRLTSSEDPTKMAQLLNYLIDWDRVEVRRVESSVHTADRAINLCSFPGVHIPEQNYLHLLSRTPARGKHRVLLLTSRRYRSPALECEVRVG